MKWYSAVLIRFIFLMVVGMTTAWAVQPSEMLSDPALEQRARELGKGLRCLVCQNQSIDDSDADLARDLRVLLRQRLQAGDSDAQVIQYMVDRYGDYVLLDPPFRLSTWVLWLGPFFLLLGGGALAFPLFNSRNIRLVAPLPLSEEEQQRLVTLAPNFSSEERKKI